MGVRGKSREKINFPLIFLQPKVGMKLRRVKEEKKMEKVSTAAAACLLLSLSSAAVLDERE